MVIVKKYKNPTPKPYTCRCPRCTRMSFCSSNKERVLKNGKNYILCPYCISKIVIKEWVVIIRQDKINKIKDALRNRN